ncbi:MAG: hypothetical protein M0D57_07345 [Sphingobacteriales bacterium JAD_PAG50586_3]|nr:MAG: hypothetical protein M0D57_07345 [Sphingobacteriales bacterium JAD_PAG50586_3]
MSEYLEIASALKNHFDSIQELKRLNIATNKKDFTSQIGEWLIAEIYGGTRAKSSIQKDWDIEHNGNYIQVKTHSKSEDNKNRWTAIKSAEGANITTLITIIFTHNYKLREIYSVPWTEALLLIKQHKGRNIIYWDHQKKYQLKIDELPNQELISIFL